MIILLSVLDVLLSLSAGCYRISLIFMNSSDLEEDPKAEVLSILSFLWGLGLRLSIIIPFFFSLSLYLEVEFNVKRGEPKVMIIYFLSIFILSLIWASVPLFFDGYGINEDASLTIIGPLLIFLAFYLPLDIIILAIIAFIWRSIHLINQHHQGEFAKNYIYFPIVLIVCYIVSIIRRILNVFEFDAEYLRFAMNSFIAMQGLFNTFYYAFLRTENKYLFLELLTGLQQKEESDYDSDEDPEKYHSLVKNVEMEDPVKE